VDRLVKVIRYLQQARRRVIQRSHELLRTLRCALKEVVGDAFEIGGRLFGPP